MEKLPPYLTITQAARLLQVHPNTLRNWDKNGVLKPIRIGIRGLRRYKREILLNYLKQS
jgi:putative resolvase